MTRRTLIAYLVSFAVLIAAIAFRVLGTRSVYGPCIVESPLQVPQANPELCHAQLTLLRANIVALLCFLIAAGVAGTLHFRDWRRYRRVSR